MASEYAHCYGGDASREYLSVEDATSNGGDASRVGFFSSLVPREKMQLLFSRVRIHLLSLSRRGTRRPH